ncbi:hypothetical protein DNH61_24385 [Paenibacillus sambharensis]|uniref:Uncharacterized protein n=1 Tax=Paenibacillus sambharensis TaxID=1803190 RepID=A0A2W1LP47_9BACL|nr:hypothetical protein [Paenibacillus sambharensis]PZD93187.1 hypothetical protein DNH61_24385 [Paenibacillus sambharensis]
MDLPYIEAAVIIILGFLTGIVLSASGIKIYTSGVHILLGCMLWIQVSILDKRSPSRNHHPIDRNRTKSQPPAEMPAAGACNTQEVLLTTH